jgi:hypothetical protein
MSCQEVSTALAEFDRLKIKAYLPENFDRGELEKRLNECFLQAESSPLSPREALCETLATKYDVDGQSCKLAEKAARIMENVYPTYNLNILYPSLSADQIHDWVHYNLYKLDTAYSRMEIHNNPLDVDNDIEVLESALIKSKALNALSLKQLKIIPFKVALTISSDRRTRSMDSQTIGKLHRDILSRLNVHPLTFTLPAGRIQEIASDLIARAID